MHNQGYRYKITYLKHFIYFILSSIINLLQIRRTSEPKKNMSSNGIGSLGFDPDLQA